MSRTSLFTLGKVTGVHGLKGFVKVRSFAESISTFAPGINLLIKGSGEGGSWYRLLEASSHKKGLLILLEGVDREMAERLVGKELLIQREDLPALDENTYYWEDLIGLTVTDTVSGYLGRVHSVIATGSNDVFVVREGKREVMVPALSKVVLRVDIENNQMVIHLPEALG